MAVRIYKASDTESLEIQIDENQALYRFRTGASYGVWKSLDGGGGGGYTDIQIDTKDSDVLTAANAYTDLGGSGSLYEPNAEVIPSTDTSTVLDDFYYVYDVSTQVTWRKPAIAAGRTIVSIAGNQLTTSSGTYTLLPTSPNQEIRWSKDAPTTLTELGVDAHSVQAINVDSRGAPTIEDIAQVRTYGWLGSQGGYGSTGKLNVNIPMRAGYTGPDSNNRGDHLGHFAHLRFLSFGSTNPAVPILINNEGHSQSLEHVSFRADKNPGVPLVELNATLYSKVSDCDFGNKTTTPGSICLESVQSKWPITYYGTNASWFSRNTFNCTGTASQLHGIHSFRDSDIENSNGTGDPRCIIGEDGSAEIDKAVYDNNYWECGTDHTHLPAPLIKIESRGNYSITNNILSNSNANHPNSDGTTCIDGYDVFLGGSCNFNFNVLSPLVQLADPTASPTGITIRTTQANYYHEFIGNHWKFENLTDNTKMIVINNKSVEDWNEVGPFRDARVYVRDQYHGEVRQNIPSRDIWTNFNNQTICNEWDVSLGKHIKMGFAPTVDATVLDAIKWRGAAFKVHFTVAFALKQGTGFFFLAKGADVVIPAGWVLEFVIDSSGNVREVGASTMHL